ncbi:MAG: aspartate/glutamate racemase family protein [Deltaproteobacteria bacterium]|nr:aspartate/glutamate racemase family protein [Deltaproteobacteria bacterium]
MKTIGLIGGMGWESSAEYYRLINKQMRERLGALHSAKILMYSVNHQEINELESRDRWPELLEMMIESSRKLEKGGADFILICCNLMHKIADQLQNAIHIPLIHIVDATSEEINAAGLTTVGLLGARAVMEGAFFKNKLEAAGLNVLTPDEGTKEFINDVVFNELAFGKIIEESKGRTLNIIKTLKENGAQGVILACTELPMLVMQEDSILPLFDTLMLHVKKAVSFALED